MLYAKARRRVSRHPATVLNRPCAPRDCCAGPAGGCAAGL